MFNTFLFSHDIQSSGCIILEAVSNENEAMVTLLCAHGAKTTGVRLTRAHGFELIFHSQLQCLSRAVELNSHLMVNVLLKKGVDPNELTSDVSF